MGLRREILTVTTDDQGDGSATTSGAINGFWWSYEYVKTDYADGVDVVVNQVNSEGVDLKLTLTNLNAAALLAPRMDRCGTTGTAASANDVLIPIIGKIQVVVAQGGDTKTGKHIITWLD